MTPAIWIAFISACPAFLAALGALVIGLRNGTKADAIHVLVDGNLGDVRRDLAEAKAELRGLRTALTVPHNVPFVAPLMASPK